MDKLKQDDMINQQSTQYEQQYQPNANLADTFFTPGLIMSILQLFCCNQITGIMALILVILANSDFKMGRMSDYQQKVKICKIITAIGVIMGILIYIFVFAIYGIAIIAEIAGT